MFHFWTSPRPQLNEVLPTVDVCAGIAHVEHMRGAPSARSERSERIDPARRTDPSTFSRPAPWSQLLYPARGCAVYSRRALTRLGFRPGLLCMSKAAAPATAGVAIDVPLIYIISRSTLALTLASSSGWFVMIEQPLDCAPMILLPGATMSGLIMLS